MEYIEENLNTRVNVENFSKAISEKWHISWDVITNYIFANISLSLTRNNNMKKDINKLYMEDKLKYYNASINSTCINHIIMMQGTLEQEIYARRVLGILLIAEFDHNLRSKVIKILRKYNPIIYSSVKKHDKEKLKNRYMKMNNIGRKIEGRFDAAIYFYFAVYRSAELVDQGFIISILKDIEDFEFGSLMTKNIEVELEEYKSEIREIKALIKREYGKMLNYKDVINNYNEYIGKMGDLLENLFITNKLDINHIFRDSEFINIDKIILSYIRAEKKVDSELIIQNIINGIFIQSLINEYKSSRNIYFENNEETVFFELNTLEKKNNNLENENKTLKSKLENLGKQKSLHDKNLNYEINRLNNIHRAEIKEMEDKIKSLENKILEEKNHRVEVESLREYELNINDECVTYDSNKTLSCYIENKKILIIGGDKEWRRKFRIKYPEIRTLNGFNENFDISILNNVEYIFFYTKYMNHSTFYKAMNFIKLNQCKFGYIGRTNIELVEQEIVEKISKIES